MSEGSYLIELRADACSHCGVLGPYTGARKCPECGSNIGWTVWKECNVFFMGQKPSKAEIFERLKMAILAQTKGVEWDMATGEGAFAVLGAGTEYERNAYSYTLKGWRN